MTKENANSDSFEGGQQINRSIDPDLLHILDKWYEAYQKIITFIGTASGIVLLYMGVHLIELVPENDLTKGDVVATIRENRYWIYSGVVSLLVSIVSMILCLVTTYNWYKSGLRRLLINAKNVDRLEKVLGDDMQYDMFAGSMGAWGGVSLVTGLLTGLFFAVGIVCYSYGVYEIFPSLIYAKG